MRRILNKVWNFFFWQLPPLDPEARRWVDGLPRLEGSGPVPRSLDGAIAEPPKK
jgi:hypothetical protein